MLTAAEFAQKCGCTRQTVDSWIRKGYISGAIYVHPPEGGHAKYLIPDDAVKPHLRMGRPFGGHAVYPSAKRLNPKPQPKMCPRDAYAYLRGHLDQSYQQISDATGYPVLILRSMYDKLHERYYC